MANRQLYFYHIITCADIEEELNRLQVYPEVHLKNETCKTRCKNGDASNGDANNTSAVTEERRGAEGDGGVEGRDGDIRLDETAQRKDPGLCAGTEGVVIAERDGGCRVRWRNGRERRYSGQTGSCERLSGDPGSLEKGIHSIGTYIPSINGEISAVYNGPYKLVAVHKGTRRRHWHLLYISNNKQWGFNSRLGRIIRNGPYKNASINCVTCLRQYLYSGSGRQVLQDILSDEHIKACECASHSCGMDGYNQWTQEAYEIECSERGNPIFCYEVGTPETELARVVDATGKTSESEARKRQWRGDSVQTEDGEILCGRTSAKHDLDFGKNCHNYDRNSNFILFLCENRAFTEAEAMEVFARTPEGIEFICSKQYGERIKSYIHVARILVFQESIKQRFERAKKKFEIDNNILFNDEYLDTAMALLRDILKRNGIREDEFAKWTFNHFHMRTGKKNNLFFYGPPSTGKTMIMNSLVECQFNFCRLTGLAPNSSFNFSSLLHTNACIMDECKLTENQFEQWKLLASGMAMSTDVKYKDRCDIQRCVLYTCSNYPIEIYCKVPMAKEAIDERTIKFNFMQPLSQWMMIPPHTWERLWRENKYDL